APASGSSATARRASARCRARTRTPLESAAWSPLRRRNCGSLRSLVQAVFLDLVEQGLVADAEDLGGLLPVPPGLGQHLQNQLALGFARGGPGDVLQRVVAGFGGRGGDRGGAGRGRNGGRAVRSTVDRSRARRGAVRLRARRRSGRHCRVAE